jgi:hypothetical protein
MKTIIEKFGNWLFIQVSNIKLISPQKQARLNRATNTPKNKENSIPSEDEEKTGQNIEKRLKTKKYFWG